MNTLVSFPRAPQTLRPPIRDESIRLLVSAAMLLLGALPASAAPRDLTPLPVGDQEVVYSQGRPFIFSEGRYTALQVSVESEDSKRIWLALSFTNLGSDSTVVFDNPLQAGVFAASGEKKVKVFARAELEKREKRRQMWENLGAGLAAGLNSYNAGQQGYGTATTRHQGTVSGYGSKSGYVSGSYMGTSTTRYYDPVAAQAAQAQAAASNRQLIESVRSDQQARSAALSASVLKTHTVRPGETYSGRLQIELPRKSRREGILLGLDVNFGNETHPFLFVVDGDVPPELVRRSREFASRKLALLQPLAASPPPAAVAAQTPAAQPPQPAPKPAAAPVPTPAPITVSTAPSRLASRPVPNPRPPAAVSTASSAAPVMTTPAPAATRPTPAPSSSTPRFQVASAGTARDTRTGSEWRIPAGTRRSWHDSDSICQSMGAGWRLAALSELRALMDVGTSVQCAETTCFAPKLFGKLPSPWVWAQDTTTDAALALHLGNAAEASFSRSASAAMTICTRSPSAAG